MRKLVPILLFLSCYGVAFSAPVKVDCVNFDLPPEWIRNEESKSGSFTSPDGLVTLVVVTRFGNYGADLLGTFRHLVERGDNTVRVISLQKDDSAIAGRTNTVTESRVGNIKIRRTYTALEYDNENKYREGAIVVVSAEPSAYETRRDEISSILSSIKIQEPLPRLPNLDDLVKFEPSPAEGGLDGLYTAVIARSYLSYDGAIHWADGKRREMLYFEPTGAVFKGAPAQFHPVVFRSCGGPTAWRCGRYRLEEGELVIKWGDGSEEHRPIAKQGNALRIGQALFQPAHEPKILPIGDYGYENDFNTQEVWVDDESQPRFRVIDSDRLEYFQMDQFAMLFACRNGKADCAHSVPARFSIDGSSIIVAYWWGLGDVLGIMQLDEERYLINGAIFRKRS